MCCERAAFFFVLLLFLSPHIVQRSFKSLCETRSKSKGIADLKSWSETKNKNTPDKTHACLKTHTHKTKIRKIVNSNIYYWQMKSGSVMLNKWQQKPENNRHKQIQSMYVCVRFFCSHMCEQITGPLSVTERRQFILFWLFRIKDMWHSMWCMHF